ncbi:MAG: hydrogenase nickel incorporation protein HypB [Rhodoferax sp.]|uniref:hydrogenase nickel incorporation protein HypB n=1 Tax=Rhodoferax sp. TaxID=50421 RepID=UPI0008D3B911|nr:hydrogenase nickel incorporation protein HypB [Rhodoferax sp.]MDP2678518.1 hydrogenase nickel incorporation protein HypB [Rhodoferax sp.]OGB58120.1 MAG: hydrogenase accessory protein HypB [Burkholderiales bacterium RIFOXYD12_FULL_59_19]OGB66435.1 MAG: hydrogenase accessory protein HypB [Burkholderiales bacterium RIFOXYC12_FULL_60_6]OGB80977.1 MAG: hydrogenase accessory protein HypB [Burkholderiales bacterium RIFOXYD2_FULL_59_8]
MCVTCGCGEGEVRIEGEAAAHVHVHVHADGTRHVHEHTHAHEQAQPHAHAHQHEHEHEHTHDPAPAHSHAPGVPPARMVQIEQDILAKNNAYAARNRQALAERGMFALNLVSSPGSGKTTLLCKTITLLGATPVAVIEGDQQTSQDADRIRASGAQAIQINTGKGCHLDAHMVGHAMAQLKLADDALLLIENVGNLVCPAAFDLGEAHKVVILSVTEGEDKPIKYPDMFRAASLMLLNKIDLLPHLSYDVDAAIGYARRVNPQIRVIQLSATSGEGMGEWLAYLRDGMAQAHAAKAQTVASLQAQIAQLKAQLEVQLQTRPNAPA